MDHPRLAVENPATGRPITTVPDDGPADVDKAVRAAVGAWPAWRVSDRHAALMSCAVVVEEAAPVLSPVLTEEQGKPLREAQDEFAEAAAWFRRFAGARAGSLVVGNGPIAAITPWSFPVRVAATQLARSFAAGDTVVLKPSPHTPLTTLHLGRMLAEVLPSGVLTVLTGREPLGEWLAAAPELNRLPPEPGGDDPAIVLPGTDPAEIAESLFWSAFTDCGQLRVAVKRVYAAGSGYDGVVEALAALAEEVVVGDGRTPGTQLGPVNNRPRYDRVTGLTEAARSDGARLPTGGPLDGPGYFFVPAIVAEAHDGMRVVAGDQCDPVLPVIRCSTVDEALGLANETTPGSRASVWGTDEEHAVEVAARLEYGTVWVNEHEVA